MRVDRRVDRSGASRRHRIQARATRSRRGSTGESILKWSEMLRLCYNCILAKERDDGGQLWHTCYRSERHILNSTSNIQPRSIRFTRGTIGRSLFSFSYFCRYSASTDTAQEAMRDDEFFRDEAYSFAPGNRGNPSNSVLSYSTLFPSDSAPSV